MFDSVLNTPQMEDEFEELKYQIMTEIWFNLSAVIMDYFLSFLKINVDLLGIQRVCSLDS